MHLTNLLTLALATGLVSAKCFDKGVEWHGSHHQAKKLAHKFCQHVEHKEVEPHKPAEWCHDLYSHGWLAHAKFVAGHKGKKAEKVPKDCAKRLLHAIKDCKHGGGSKDKDGWFFLADPGPGLCRHRHEHNATQSHHYHKSNTKLYEVEDFEDIQDENEESVKLQPRTMTDSTETGDLDMKSGNKEDDDKKPEGQGEVSETENHKKHKKHHKKFFLECELIKGKKHKHHGNNTQPEEGQGHGNETQPEGGQVHGDHKGKDEFLVCKLKHRKFHHHGWHENNQKEGHGKSESKEVQNHEFEAEQEPEESDGGMEESEEFEIQTDEPEDNEIEPKGDTQHEVNTADKHKHKHRKPFLVCLKHTKKKEHKEGDQDGKAEHQQIEERETAGKNKKHGEFELDCKMVKPKGKKHHHHEGEQKQTAEEEEQE